MKYLVAGLGNIGAEYRHTRHNIGFRVLDAFAEASNIFFNNDRLAAIAEYKFKGKTIIFIQPSTYMNLSGKAVNYWMQKEKISIENLLVIVDDIALPFGTVRIKTKGSDGGHNGLKSIQECLGHQNYCRLKFGIGADFPKGKQIDYVLGEWSGEEMKYLPERMNVCIDAIKCFVFEGISSAMSKYNNK